MKRSGLLIVIALMLAYSAYFSAYSIQRHNTFRTYASDMGQMDQALWNTLHGNILQDTRPNGQNLPRLTDHVEPIFLVVPFVFVLYDNIASLFVLQSLALALGALPIYWIARRRLQSEWAAVIFAAMYLLFPALQAANLAEFHAVTFAPAPLMFAYNYGQERAWKRFALFALIALGVKEDMALLVLALGLYFAIKRTDDQRPTTEKQIIFHISRFTFNVSVIPLLMAIVSFAWFLVALYVIVPHFSPHSESVYIGRYPTSPWTMLAGIFIPEKIAYVIKLLASVGFLAVFDPISLLIGSPSLVLNLLSGYDAQYSGTYHYSAPVAPYFVLAAIGGAAAIRHARFVVRKFASRALALIVIPAFVISLIYQTIAGYTPLGGEYVYPAQTTHQQLLARFLAEIPPDVPVSTTTTLFPHLSHRLKLYRFPTILDAQYILLDVSQSNTTNPVDYRVNYLNALKQGFGIRDAVDGYILLQRGVAQKDLPDGFYTFVRGCECVLPQNPVQVDFGDKVRMLGYDVKQDDWHRVYLRTYWTRLPTMDDNNYTPFPFFPDADGNPRADAQLPDLLIQFWYPTSRWQGDEIVTIDTTPIDVGARAQIGVGMFFGATWSDAEFYLTPKTSAPISADGRWVSLGALERVGKTYRVEPSQ